MTSTDWRRLSEQLVDALALTSAPMAITFTAQVPPGIPAFDEPMSPPTEDGRSGRVLASCVFWTHAATRTFSTVPQDHGNCSVGRVVHGLTTLDDVAANTDVDALLGAGWVTEAAVTQIPVVRSEPKAIIYGPLHEVVEQVQEASRVNAVVSDYALADTRRFRGGSGRAGRPTPLG